MICTDEEYKQNILLLIVNNEWMNIYNYILKIQNIHTLINNPIINGNNIFHIACIKGQLINELLHIKKKVGLNINLVNSEGKAGAYLYYKYGGTDTIFLDNKEICYKSDNSALIPLLIDNITLLELLINRMIDANCIDIIDSNNIYNIIMEKINHYKICDNIKSDKYLLILNNIYQKLHPPDLVFLAITNNNIDVINMLINNNFNFNVYSHENISTISLCVIMGYVEILIIILEYTKHKYGDYEVFRIVNDSDINYDMRPIFLSINNIQILQILINYISPYLEHYNLTNNTQYMFDSIDSEQNTYLHYILLKYHKRTPPHIISFFIKHTNLNKENYAGNTPAHLLFSKNIWEEYIHDLYDAEIDLLKPDSMGYNCYYYGKNNNVFTDFIKKIKIVDTKEHTIFNVLNIKQFLKTSHSKNTQFIFHSTLPYNMLYLKYIENKHPMLYVPTQCYNKINVKNDIFMFNNTSYIISKKNTVMIKNLNQYLTTFYSYMPYQIYWIDDDNYYIHPNLINILKHHDYNIKITKQRYVILKITIIINVNISHANMLIYDRLTKEAWHFEPYGISKITNIISLGDFLKKLIQQIYGSVIYYSPTDFLHGLNFQMVGGEDYYINKNISDPGGFCAAWSIWFVDIVLTYQHINIKTIMKQFFNRESINIILSDEEGEQIKSKNYYLDFIRKYAHKLNNEKNIILLNNGIKKYNLYNNTLFEDEIKIIKKIFEIKCLT